MTNAKKITKINKCVAPTNFSLVCLTHCNKRVFVDTLHGLKATPAMKGVRSGFELQLLPNFGCLYSCPLVHHSIFP